MTVPHLPSIQREIEEQPRVLAGVLSSARARIDELVEPRRWRRLHLVGCGDMFFAARVVSWLARLELPLEVQAWRSMDFHWITPRLGADDLVVCASVSGRTPRTIEAAGSARRTGARVLGISDNEGAPLCREVDDLVLLGASPPASLNEGPYPGYHHQVAQTKTYTAALLAELLVAARAAGQGIPGLERVPSKVAAALPELSRAVGAGAADWFAGRRNVAVLASGPHRATASYGAAKFIEYAVPAHARCLEEFNHLEMFLADRLTLVVVLAPDGPEGASGRRAAELLEPWEELGVRSLVVGPPARYPGRRTALVPLAREEAHVAPFLQALALQILAYRGAVALGRDPDLWVGGVRTDLILDISRAAIRGSKRLGPAPDP